ncbi:tripartite tricarboxylate transporter TctB family protein [Brevibacillus humidisoli]|uniref:tripartite tricarboxylate transporter TctB family protein n=1 Tax=Brevibacillus humidisoli TaxID=2895522 RepID=UPI001E32D277|nr:tripartite tricarboxylate transporter TctB family protein [Brevibacillus humidisoli]UFJ40302.1 tripartite tricarboxylate transporter TctB family protein [Brevibacillus humidisoli]
MGEILFHVLLLICLGAFFKESLVIDTTRVSDPIGPAGFPQAILIIAIVLTLVSLFQTIRKRKAKAEVSGGGKPHELSKEFIGLLLTISIYVLIVDTLGFILATILLLFALLFLLGEKKPGKVVILSIVGSFGFSLLFGNLLSVPLPRGIEILKQLSYYIY